MILQSANIHDYLQRHPAVDWDHPAIQARSRALVAGATSDIEKAKRIFEWVRDAIPHSKDINAEIVTCNASEVLAQGTGICYAKSHLLAALCRAAGIPAGFCYQVYRNPDNSTGVHALNAVYLSSLQKWIRLDARGNTGDINAQFSVDQEQLAFPVDPTKGELFIYQTVFTNPVPQVVDVLKKYTTRSTLFENLPPLIPDALLCAEDRAFNATLDYAPKRRQ
ncbi:MAG: transglutaminase family protein [Gammaproteobacteria bacterium]|nr:transglutaminase family protein [Gammaproteobacteria bacterium]